MRSINVICFFHTKENSLLFPNPSRKRARWTYIEKTSVWRGWSTVFVLGTLHRFQLRFLYFTPTEDLISLHWLLHKGLKYFLENINLELHRLQTQYWERVLQTTTFQGCLGIGTSQACFLTINFVPFLLCGAGLNRLPHTCSMQPLSNYLISHPSHKTHIQKQKYTLALCQSTLCLKSID